MSASQLSYLDRESKTKLLWDASHDVSHLALAAAFGRIRFAFAVAHGAHTAPPTLPMLIIAWGASDVSMSTANQSFLTT